MASPFKALNIYINHKGYKVLSWQYSAGAVIPQGSSITIEYARSGGPWQILDKQLPLSSCYTDARRTNRNKYNNDFYRVSVVTPSGRTYTSEPQQAGIDVSYPYSAQAANLMRLSELQAQKTGRTGYLLKKIIYGPKCPVCQQFEDDSPVNQHCPHCLGTGRKGGYYKAIPLNILQNSQSTQTDISITGQVQNKQINAKCTAWPLIRPGDVWVDDRTNQRYIMDQVSVASKYKHIPLVYFISMHYIEQTDTLHSEAANDLLQQALVQYVPNQWQKAF